MNHKEIIKSLILIKISVINSLINLLPEDAREKASALRQDIIEAVGEAANEAIKDKNTGSKDTSIKKVTIE